MLRMLIILDAYFVGAFVAIGTFTRCSASPIIAGILAVISVSVFLGFILRNS